MTLYDTAGMERFEGTVPPTYFRNACAVIFVYAINTSESINNIPSWAENISVQRLGPMSNTIIKALVGNKSDLDSDREVTVMRGKETAERSEIPKHLVFEVSAMTGQGVDKMFATIARELKGKKEPIQNLPPPQKKSSCCASQ